MKKLIFTIMVCALMATPVLASSTLDSVSPHLGWWPVGHPSSTHQYWDFSDNVEVDGANYDWIATPPTEMENTAAVVMIGTGNDTVVYDPTNDWFTHDTAIAVTLNIKNYPPNAYKEIWVDIGYTSIVSSLDADGIGPVTYTTTVLPGPGPSGVAEFGFKIVPNPVEEFISFTIIPPFVLNSFVAPPSAVLEWIHVDTVCIPAPGAILLGSIGVGLVGWLRRRRTL